MVVCNVRKMECMVYWCHKWPTYTALKEYVESSCDDIGGKKHKEVCRPVTNQILTFKAMEELCNENMVGITFFSIYKKDTVQVREALDVRYLLGDTVPGTRSCHHFEPSSTTPTKGYLRYEIIFCHKVAFDA